MKYKKSKTWYQDRLDNLKRYTTKQEKEFLLLEDDVPLIDKLKTLTDTKPLNELDAMALMFKLREISVSNIIEIQQECHCGSVNAYNIDTNDFFNFDFEDGIPLGVFESINDIINTKITDKLILKEYNKIQEKIVKNAQKVFSPVVKKQCKKCKDELEVMVNPNQIISKSSPASIYQDYLSLSYYSNFSKLDTDSMYPFEREIFLKLLSEKIKEEPKLGG